MRERKAERERRQSVSVFGGVVLFAYAWHTLIKRCHVACFHFDVRHFEFLSLSFACVWTKELFIVASVHGISGTLIMLDGNYTADLIFLMSNEMRNILC